MIITLFPFKVFAATIGGYYSLEKSPCIEQFYEREAAQYWSMVRYYCYDDNVVKIAQQGMEDSFYDRKGRLQKTVKMANDYQIDSTKIFYENGALRAHWGSSIDNLVNYDDGGLKEKWLREGRILTEVQYYDKSGELTNVRKGDEFDLRTEWQEFIMDYKGEKILKEMAIIAELYAQEHDGKYPLKLLESDTNGYPTACNTSNADFTYNCTNTEENYHYTAVPINICGNCGYKRVKQMEIKTGEIYTETTSGSRDIIKPDEMKKRDEESRKYNKKVTRRSNAENAKLLLHSLSEKAEAYASGHDGKYPTQEKDLMQDNMKNRSLGLCNRTNVGFIYSCVKRTRTRSLEKHIM